MIYFLCSSNENELFNEEKMKNQSPSDGNIHPPGGEHTNVKKIFIQLQ